MSVNLCTCSYMYKSIFQGLAEIVFLGNKSVRNLHYYGLLLSDYRYMYTCAYMYLYMFCPYLVTNSTEVHKNTNISVVSMVLCQLSCTCSILVPGGNHYHGWCQN